MPDTPDILDRAEGVLLGTAVGDAIGLPRESLSPRRAARLFGWGPLRHRFLFGRGMISDDTEHACMVTQAFLAADGEPKRFARSLAWRLRLWLGGLPAGVGMGTLKGIVRLWLGFPPGRSGVRSAGNGPAMRSPILGLCAGDDPRRLAELVAASTRLTHRDDRAEQGALAVAAACHYASIRTADDVDPAEVFQRLRQCLTNDEFRGVLDQSERALARGLTASQLAEMLGLVRGVTGYVVHTVPMAVFCWLRHPGDFRAAVEEVILLGGDADTTGAITGALAGATVGAAGIPADWLAGIFDWPRSVKWIRRLARRLVDQVLRPAPGAPPGPLRLFWPGLIPRNVLFLLVVLLHGLRRLLPPYGRPRA